MMNSRWSLAVGGETGKTKERGTRGEKVKTNNNSYDKERK
jgi:hypothetical protein